MVYDIAVIGAGPAGLMAAIQGRVRNKSVLVVSNEPTASALCKAPVVDNYPGVPHVSGKDLVEAMVAQAKELGAEFAVGRVLNVMSLEGEHYLNAGSQVFQARKVILAPGVVRSARLPGEEALLGRGVSYCATCDGMLYRGKKVAVIGLSADAPEEAEFLRSIGCEVEYFDASRAKKYEILGSERVEKLLADGVEYEVSCVFILRSGVAPGSLVPGLELDGPHIKVDADMATSVPGVFAAGDCVGAPYQVGKAVGEGNIAGISAAKYVENILKEEK